jgi:hypothetical protein
MEGKTPFFQKATTVACTIHNTHQVKVAFQFTVVHDYTTNVKPSIEQPKGASLPLLSNRRILPVNQDH